MDCKGRKFGFGRTLDFGLTTCDRLLFYLFLQKTIELMTGVHYFS